MISIWLFFIVEPPSERIERKYPNISPCLTLRWEETVAYTMDDLSDLEGDENRDDLTDQNPKLRSRG
jgi:hypothetical protein